MRSGEFSLRKGKVADLLCAPRMQIRYRRRGFPREWARLASTRLALFYGNGVRLYKIFLLLSVVWHHLFFTRRNSVGVIPVWLRNSDEK